jgi:hypothetical protein
LKPARRDRELRVAAQRLPELHAAEREALLLEERARGCRTAPPARPLSPNTNFFGWPPTPPPNWPSVTNERASPV